MESASVRACGVGWGSDFPVAIKMEALDDHGRARAVGGIGGGEVKVDYAHACEVGIPPVNIGAFFVQAFFGENAPATAQNVAEASDVGWRSDRTDLIKELELAQRLVVGVNQTHAIVMRDSAEKSRPMPLDRSDVDGLGFRGLSIRPRRPVQ